MPLETKTIDFTGEDFVRPKSGKVRSQSSNAAVNGGVPPVLELQGQEERISIKEDGISHPPEDVKAQEDR